MRAIFMLLCVMVEGFLFTYLYHHLEDRMLHVILFIIKKKTNINEKNSRDDFYLLHFDVYQQRGVRFSCI